MHSLHTARKRKGACVDFPDALYDEYIKIYTHFGLSKNSKSIKGGKGVRGEEIPTCNKVRDYELSCRHALLTSKTSTASFHI